MTGWLLHEPLIFGSNPGIAIMQFNSALCITLTGFSLLAIFSRRRFSLFLSLLSGFIAAITIVEYLTACNLIIDQMIVTARYSVATAYPGRMAPNTAISLLMLNSSVVLYCLFSTTFTRLIQLTLVVLVFCIALVALFGYLLDIEIVYNWPGFSPMPALNAFCFILLSISLSIFFYSRFHRFYAGHGMVQTMSILVVGILFFMLIWQNFAEDAFQQIHKKIAVDSTMIANEIHLKVQSYYISGKRFFARINHLELNNELIEDDARGYLRDIPNLSVITWGKDNQHILWSGDQSRDIDLQLVRQACQLGMKKNDISAHILINAATKWVPYLCLDSAGNRPALMLFNIQGTITSAAELVNTKLTGIRIEYAGRLIFNKTNETSPVFVNKWLYIQALQFDFLPAPLVFKLWPSLRYVRENGPWLPLITVVLGLIITSLLALVNHLKNKVLWDNSILKTSITSKSKKLLEVESKYQRIFDNSPDLLLFLDTSYRIIECNQTLMRTIGVVRKKNLIGHSIFEILNLKNTMLEKNITTRIGATGVINNLEIDLINQFDSTSRMMLKVNPFIIEGNKTIGYLFSFRDISNIKALQEELVTKKYSENLFRENKAIYDLILDETTDGWWDINLETKDCILSNKLLRSLGYDIEHFSPTFSFFADHAIAEDFVKIESNLKKHISTKGKYPFHQEVRYRHRNGKLVWILCRGQGIVDPDGRIRRIVGTHIDISALKFTQDKLSLKNLELDLIYKTTRIILVAEDIKQACKSCLAVICQAIKFPLGIVYSFNEACNRLEANAAWHQNSDGDEAVCLTKMNHLIVQKGQGIAGRVWQENKTILVENNERATIAQEQAACSHFHPRTALAFPIMVAENIYMVFELFCEDIQQETVIELEMIDLLAAQMSLAVERKLAYSQLRHLALHDELTTLPNRRACMEMLGWALSRAKRNHTEFGLMFLDLDDFKQVNDSFGHHIGDLLLIEVSKAFKQSIREHDYLARLAGDEFLLIVTDLSESSTLTTLAERLIASVANPFILENHAVKVSVSIGIATYPQAGDSVEDMLKKADSALYKVKNEGKQSFYFSNPG